MTQAGRQEIIRRLAEDYAERAKVLSLNFEDEHWNTPAGVQEAIGIWGRPIGNRIGQRFN